MDQGEREWISMRVDEALRSWPVDDAIASTVKGSLAGTMCDRALSDRELTDLAKILVDTITAFPCGESGK